MQKLLLLIKKIKNFIRFNWKDKILFFEAFILCGVARFLIFFVPFRRVKKYMGTSHSESPLEVDEQKYIFVNRVAVATRRASKCTPWESKCLVKALAVQWMLKSRKLYSTIYLGVNKDGEHTMRAHAWLRFGELIVTGGSEMKNFKQVAKFSNYKK